MKDKKRTNYQNQCRSSEKITHNVSKRVTIAKGFCNSGCEYLSLSLSFENDVCVLPLSKLPLAGCYRRPLISK